MERWMKQENTFEYTYSAKRQEEVEAIKQKYMPKQEDKLEQLRRLDRSVEIYGTIAAVATGVIGILVFGGGMSMVMVWEAWVPGILTGIIGFLMMAAALPVYKRVMRKRRQKIAPQVMALSEELLK